MAAPIAGIAVATASAAPATTTVLSANFDDGALDGLSQSGNPTYGYVANGSGQALSISGRVNSWDSVSVPSTLFQAGKTYTVSMKVKLAAGTADTQAHFTADVLPVVSPATSEYTWIGAAAVTASGWTTISGTFAVPEGSTKIGLSIEADAVGGALPSFLLDDVLITVPADSGTPDDGTITPGQLSHVIDYGYTSAGIDMYMYVPNNLPQNAPIVVAVHNCTTSASYFYSSTRFAALAEHYGYIVIYPQASRSGKCFDVSSTQAMTHDGGSDPTAIAHMVAYVQAHYSTDATKVFATGLSSGAMMTEVLMADYPDVFAAGSVYAGVPDGCFATGTAAPGANDAGWNNACALGNVSKTGQQWGDIARAAFPGYSGPRPRVQLWHGTADTTLAYANYGEAVKQWTNVLGVSATPAATDNVSATRTRDRFGATGDQAPVEGNYLAGATHNLTVNETATLTFFGLSPIDGWTGSTCDYPTGNVIDTDFEDGTPGTWSARDNGKGTGTLSVVAGAGHDGGKALLITNRVSQGQGIIQEVTCRLDPEQTYELTGWVRFAAGQKTDEVDLSYEARTGDANPTYAGLGQVSPVSNTTWTPIDIKFTPPSADRLFIYFETKWSSTSDGNTSDLMFDDLKVAKVNASVQDITPIKDTLPFPVGAAVSDPQLTGLPGQLLAKHFDQVTPENTMKPEGWYNVDHSFVTSNPGADKLMTFSELNGLRVHGHTLVWYQQTPDWFFQDANGQWLTSSATDKQIMRDRLKTHIDNVAKYLSDHNGPFGSATNPLVSFDVVNEVVSDNLGDPQGLRQSHWYQILGDEYIKLAFQDADEAFNHTYAQSGVVHPVELFINDYNTEQPGKRARLLDLVHNLIAADVPIDGVGHQFHVTMSTPVSSLKDAFDAFNGITTASGRELLQDVSELDVPTGTPVTTANQIDQGWYYKAVFDMLRDEAAHGSNIWSVTLWGLVDGQSWRNSAGAPLLFDDALQAKPAYYGVTDQALAPQVRTALVFAGDVTGANQTAAVDWSSLPLHAISDKAAFQLRWAADHLTAYVSVDDSTSNATDAVTFKYGANLTATVKRNGTTTGAGVTAQVVSTSTGWKVVAKLPESGLSQGDSTQFDVAVTDGTTTTGWNTGDATGTLSLVEALSYTEIPQAATAPTIDGTKDAVWDTSSTVVTNKKISGSDTGAKATVHQLWKDNYLYILAEVTDPTIDSSSPNAYEQDSVEIFTDPGNAKNGSYRPDDMQIRIGADGKVSFGGGDTEAAQQARIQTAAKIVTGGYVVEARFDLKDGNTGVGKFEGLDYSVNDGTNGGRTANFAWAEPTGTAYQTTSRWGVAQLVAAPSSGTGSTGGSGSTAGPVTVTGAHGETLTISSGTVAAGGFLVVSATGLTAGDPVQVILHSKPVVLAKGTVAANGTFSATVKIPASTPAGLHHIEVATPHGSLTVALTVTKDPSGALAATGSDVRDVVAVALLALLLGGLAFGGSRVAARRR